MLLDWCAGTGLAALIATHNLDLAARMDRILALEDGVVVEQARGLRAARMGEGA